ncbi:hypothetical protein SLS60_004288 [Paraconiothyrium brasiliense]|uniref:Uncharacterized protein n=1 Tax=Paraconiothyrium brasiliense TaxID=300254 RepID=A0ABR3RJX1_9PLEO
MATNNDPTQQQRYAMRERTGSRPEEVYRPDQDVPDPNGEPSTLSSIRSDSEKLDERMRDGLVRTDALDQSTFYHRSSMLKDRSAGLNQDNTEQQHRPQYPIRSWASRDANTENRGLADYLQVHHNSD